RELGFSLVVENSLDGTASRDLVAEFAYITAQLGVDLSRLSEDIILWNTREFGFVTLDDGYSTGSSIMPRMRAAWSSRKSRTSVAIWSLRLRPARSLPPTSGPIAAI
ncbi:lyase family protein, partial [Rhizobium johnstonii]|uniref:lyase family protein n=1 Tax=Rhizobium johnstonii TaxID=3019933 RepID=UPI003F976665